MYFENVHNHFEHLVKEHIQETLVQQQGITDQNYLEDIACIALNQLPPRYVRHSVDTAYFTSDTEHEQIHQQISKAVTAAIRRLKTPSRT